MKEEKNNSVKADVTSSAVLNTDCMLAMKNYPDKFFNLAIVDPPYGIGLNEMALGSGRWKDGKKWDDATPTGEYFNELWRVSKNQIVWGMNFLNDYLPKCNMTIVWDKENGNSFGSDYELAWTSFESKRQRIFRQFWISNMIPAEEKPRIHPAQKPIKLYEWILKEFATKGDLILDPFLGTGTTLEACKNTQRNGIGIELNDRFIPYAEEVIKQNISK